jgi:hypothetical protein
MLTAGRLAGLAVLLLVASCGATARRHARHAARHRRHHRAAVGHHHADDDGGAEAHARAEKSYVEPEAGDPLCACASGKEGECAKEHHGFTGYTFQWCYVAGGAAAAKTCPHVLKSEDIKTKGWKKCGADLGKHTEKDMMKLMFKMMTTMVARGHETDKARGNADVDGVPGQASMDAMAPQLARRVGPEQVAALARRAVGKAQAMVQGVDRISSGYDVVTGQLKLPTLYFSKRQESLSDDPISGRAVPAAVALVREASAESSVARETFSDTKTLASRMAEDLGLESSFGYMTMSPAVSTLRRIQIRSDLTIARRVHKKYALRLYPFGTDAGTERLGEDGHSDGDAPQQPSSSSLSAALMDAILPIPTVGGPVGDSGKIEIPDCVLHDCMIRHEGADLPGMAKCTMKGGVMTPAVSCASTYSASVRANCMSTFFEPADAEWTTAASKLSEKDMCSAKQSKLLLRQTNSNITCVTFGADHGQICNAHDMVRIGRFVRRWGTHFVDSATFGGQMEIQVQLRKNRGVEGRVAGHRAAEEAIYKAAPPHSPVMDLLAEDFDKSGGGGGGVGGGNGDGDDATSARDASSATRLNTLNTIAMTEAAGNGKVLDHVHERRFSPRGRSQDYDKGVEEVAVSFIGGTSTPPSSVETSPRDVLDWSNSIGHDPSLLPTNILLRPMADLLRHPSIEVEILRRATMRADNWADPKCACASGKEGECGKEHHLEPTSGKKYRYTFQWCYVAGGAAAAKTCPHVLKSGDYKKKGWKKCGADLEKGGKKAKGWTLVKTKEISRLRGVIKRKLHLLRNHLRWFLAKSERIGTLNDEAEQMKAVAESRLHHLRTIALDFTTRITRDLALRRGHTDDSDDSRGRRGADQDTDDWGRDATGERLGKIALGAGSKIIDSAQQKACHAMIEYVLAYRDGLHRFDLGCHAYCDKKKDAELVLGQMYGKFRVGRANQNVVAQGRSGDNDKLSLTDAGFSLKRSHRLCHDECKHKKEVIAVSAKEMESEDREGTMRRDAQTGVMVDMHHNPGVDADGIAVDLEGGGLFDFSSRTFFTGVDSVCKVCNGVVAAVATSMADQDVIEAREICSNGQLRAFMQADAWSPVRAGEDFAAEPDYTAVGDGTPLLQFGASICLGVVLHLEQVLERVIRQHGLLTVPRPHLRELLTSWIRHSSTHAPRAVATHVCRRYFKCGDGGRGGAAVDGDGATSAKALAEKAVEAQKAEEATEVRLKTSMAKVTAAAKALPKKPTKKKPKRDWAKFIAPLKTSLDEKLAVLKKKLAAEKALIAKTKADQKSASATNKEVEKEDKTANDFCKFECLAQNAWGKANEKANPYAAGVFSQNVDGQHPYGIAAHGNHPCGKIQWPKREGKCATCSSMECVAQARYDCFVDGRVMTGSGVQSMGNSAWKPVACDSRYVMLDGQYIDGKFPVYATTRKEMTSVYSRMNRGARGGK